MREEVERDKERCEERSDWELRNEWMYAVREGEKVQESFDCDQVVDDHAVRSSLEGLNNLQLLIRLLGSDELMAD